MEAIRTAALRYPAPAREASAARAPISLTASDGTGLELISLEARAAVEGPLALTELRLRFRNPRQRVVEGRFSITLPDGATISRFAMRLPSGWQEAEVVERQAAREVYETYLHRGRDPALLERKAGNAFRARVFPIPAGGAKDLIVSYSQQLVGTYRLPLVGLPRMDRLTISARVNVGGGPPRTTRLVRRRVTPQRDFELQLPVGVVGLRHGTLVVARITPRAPVRRAAVDGLLVLLDTSASMAARFPVVVTRLSALVKTLRSTYGDQLPLQIVCFDQAATPLFRGKAGGFSRRHEELILARRALGASNLAGALRRAAGISGYRRLLIITDGVLTAGEDRVDALRRSMRRLRAGFDRADVLLTGGIRDRALMRRLVTGVLPQGGAVLELGDAPRRLAGRLGQRVVSGVEVRVPGARRVWPSTLDGVLDGESTLVFAALEPRALPSGEALTINLAGALGQTFRVAPSSTPGALLRRAVVGARVAMLERRRVAASPADSARLRRQIVDLSIRHRVLSEHTAMLVLETAADYRRAGLHRRPPASILGVGKRGVIERRQGKRPARLAAPPRLPDPSPARAVRGALDKEIIRRVVRNHLGEIKRCTQITGAGLSGRTVAHFTISPSGKVLVPRFTRSGPRRRTLETCLSRAMQGWVFPKPKGGGIVMVSYPFALRSSGVAGAEAQAALPPGDPIPAGAVVSGAPDSPARFREVKRLLAARRNVAALLRALSWRAERPGDLLAVIALGQALAARGQPALAARAYGSIIDMYPSRAEMRRLAGQRLEALGRGGLSLAVDAYDRAVRLRPDHLNGYRLLGYALLRRGDPRRAFSAVAAGLEHAAPAGRFPGIRGVLREDLGLIAAARRRPAARSSPVPSGGTAHPWPRGHRSGSSFTGRPTPTTWIFTSTISTATTPRTTR